MFMMINSDDTSRDNDDNRSDANDCGNDHGVDDSPHTYEAHKAKTRVFHFSLSVVIFSTSFHTTDILPVD